MQKYKGNIVDIMNKKIYPGVVKVQNGKIHQIAKSGEEYDRYIIPGFIDSHIHIESTMLTPTEFARIAVQHGTVAAICDPHEIANVMGVSGIDYMIDNSRKSPFKFYFSAPSCVPATELEASGAKIGPEEVESLFQEYPEIKFLGEMMNYPGVVNDDPEVMRKIEIANEYNKPIDGHAPGLRGDDLEKYVAVGVSTDHECTSKEEALRKLKLGMTILIREGSAAKNFDELIQLADEHYKYMAFCTDDQHPDDLVNGHINELVRRAIVKGLDPIKVFRMATLNPVKHYNLDVGLLRKNDPADFLIVDNLKSLDIQATVINGNFIFEDGVSVIQPVIPNEINKFEVKPKQPDDFIVPAKNGLIDVIEAQDGKLITNRMQVEPKILNHKIVSDSERDILKITLINRYKDREPVVAFVKNFGLKKGAIASSVAHDSHNILAVGVTDEDITEAINRVINNKGGLSAVCTDDDIAETLALPIAGLMSARDYSEVASKYKELDQLAGEFGSTLRSPFMTLSFMALLVIPEIKLGSEGLFDVTNFEYIKK